MKIASWNVDSLNALLAAGIVARQALLRAQIDAIAADLEGEAA